jgi:CheY-like chemotaxis protein
MMPGIDWFETCRRLKADPDTAAAPVIFLTARSELDGVIEGFQAGGVDYISKPFQKEKVLIRIRTHLGKDRLARDLADLNAHLEQKVQERTVELRQKVIELEGRDRIAQHLLTYHSREETLLLVLQVCSDISGVSTLGIHLRTEDAFTVRAALQNREPVSHENLASRAPISLDQMRDHVPGADAVRESDRIWIPIPADSGIDLLGVIEVEEPANDALEDHALAALSGFAVQVAVAVTDAQIHDNAGKWKDQLDALLKLDDVANTMEQLDSMAEARKANQ